MLKQYVIVVGELPIGFFQEQKDAQEALGKYVKQGYVTTREMCPYSRYGSNGVEKVERSEQLL